MGDIERLLAELRDERARIISAMVAAEWTDEHVRDLADIQSAIAAVEARIAEIDARAA